MLRRLAVLALTGLGVGVSLAAAAVPLALPVYTDLRGGDGESTPAPSVVPSAGDGQVAVTVVGVGATVEGGSFPVARTEAVSPVCRYGPDLTGPEYYDVWNGEDGTAMASGTLRDYAYQGLLYPDFEAYQDEMTGRWYGPVCRSDAPVDYKLQYWADHPAVYWLPADPVPSSRADVDPRQLAQIAYEFTDLPTGTVGWNPTMGGVGATIVNLDTWVWVAGAPVTVSVRASVPGTWAQVEAQLDHVELSAPGADPATCDEPGVPWTAGATSTPCAIWFTHSSANQPVKDGQTLPTSTLTVTAVWTASWTSSDNPAPTALPTQEITTTAEVPVAEIQTLVTRG